MARLTVYESKAVSVVFAGIPLGDGRAENFFKIASHGPAYVTTGPGADGQVTRCGTNDNLYTITLTFMGSSAENAKLSAIHIEDRVTSNGAGIAPLLVKDGNGSTLIQTDTAWITKMPDMELGVQRKDVEWELQAQISPGGLLLGGN